MEQTINNKISFYQNKIVLLEENIKKNNLQIHNLEGDINLVSNIKNIFK